MREQVVRAPQLRYMVHQVGQIDDGNDRYSILVADFLHRRQTALRGRVPGDPRRAAPRPAAHRPPE